MSYEVHYFYHERQEGGKYNTAETKELTKNVGQPFDDLPLEKLAAVVMGQLARRDIWVVDVKINEFVKKELSFKESTDGKGIIIKGKKFSFGASAEMLVEDVEYLEPQPQMMPMGPQAFPVGGGPQVNLVPPRGPQYPHNNMANRASNAGRVLTHMVFDPEIQNLHEARKAALQFTVGNKYPIYQVEQHPMGLQFGQIYTTVDDKGTTQTISDKFFIPAIVKLVGDDEVQGGFSRSPVATERGPRLSFENELRGDVQNIRQQPTARPARGAAAGQPREVPPELRHIPLDNGQIPEQFFEVPDLGRKIK